MLNLKIHLFTLFQLIICCFPVHCKNVCSSSNCKTNKQLCKFQNSQIPARHCLNFEKLIKSDDDKLLILDKINGRRNKVASGEIRSYPSSDSMLKLEWNSKLELSAQRWANQCVKHSTPDIKDACRDFDNIEVGQNIASIYGESPGLIISALVDIWYMELLNANGSILAAFKSSVEGGIHYDYFTQLVWANTTEVGCGSVKFQERLHDQDGSKNRTVYRLVCNFLPSGNREYEPVYTTGPPCSRCPNHTTCDTVYRALCSKREQTQDSLETTTITNNMTVTLSFNNVDNVSKDDVKEASKGQSNLEEESDEEYTPFDFFSHLRDLTTQSITLGTPAKIECKDDVAVDAFIDILRKKLSNDHVFKEMLLTTKPGVVDVTFSDPSVAAFVNKIYSKTELSTTAKSTQSKGSSSEKAEVTSPIASDVSPIKVRAEMAQIQQNEDFTGHYFFPEDEEGITTEDTESTDFNYDAPNLSIGDVMLEIEEIKKNTVTRNFLDEILEMESTTDTSTAVMVLRPDDLNAHKTGHEVMKKFLEDIRVRDKARK